MSILENYMKMIDETMQRTRSDYHLTLGELIKFLEKEEDDKFVMIKNYLFYPSNFNSYRGYYSDLAIGCIHSHAPSVREFRFRAQMALGGKFEGYKGGVYEMKENTPLWIAEWGNASGLAVVDIETIDDKVYLLTKQMDSM